MAKQAKEEVSNNSPEKEEIPAKEVSAKIEEKVEAVKEKAKEAGLPGKAVNIIGDIKPPENPENKSELKDYFEKLDKKLDQLLAKKAEAEKIEELPIERAEDKKPISFWDREVF